MLRIVKTVLCLSIFLCVDSHAFPSGVQAGVGVSALGGLNVIVGYKYFSSKGINNPKNLTIQKNDNPKAFDN